MGFYGEVEYTAIWACDECGKTERLSGHQETGDMLDKTLITSLPAPPNWAILRWINKVACEDCRDKILDEL